MALTRLGLNQSINLATNTTGTLAVGNGGTGLTSGTSGQFLKFTGSTTVASSAVDTGKIGQIVQDVKSSIQTINSGSYALLTSLDVDITPVATSSKILIIISIPTFTIAGTDNEGLDFSLYRNGSAEYKFGGNFGYKSDGAAHNDGISFTRIHEPSSTSQQTYAVYCKRNGNSNGDICTNSTQATITAMEILA